MEEYARHGPQDLFLSEESPLDAATVYGVTKSCAEAIGKSYVRNFGCQIVFTRSFNHTGPGQSTEYVLSDFARQCAEISVGARDPVIHVGNLDVQRDFLDVEDVVRAYLRLMDVGTAGTVYNCVFVRMPLPQDTAVHPRFLHGSARHPHRRRSRPHPTG